jgi:predicted small secreted protein
MCVNSVETLHSRGKAMKYLMTLLVVSTALLLSACNTVKGVGQDIQKAGEKIEGAAKK